MKHRPIKPPVHLEDMGRLDIRVGMMEKVEAIGASDTFVRLTVDFGEFKRTILTDLRDKERQDPLEMEGKQALFIVNLRPTTVAGEPSEGMIMEIGYANDIPFVLAIPEKPVPNGTIAA